MSPTTKSPLRHWRDRRRRARRAHRRRDQGAERGEKGSLGGSQGRRLRCESPQCAYESRTRTSATSRTPWSICLSKPWRAPTRRKQKRRRAKPATNFGWLNEFCSHRPSINLRWIRRSRGRAESKPLVKLRPASPARYVANRYDDSLLLADENHEALAAGYAGIEEIPL
jgi:hypothetical protein